MLCFSFLFLYFLLFLEMWNTFQFTSLIRCILRKKTLNKLPANHWFSFTKNWKIHIHPLGHHCQLFCYFGKHQKRNPNRLETHSHLWINTRNTQQISKHERVSRSFSIKNWIDIFEMHNWIAKQERVISMCIWNDIERLYREVHIPLKISFWK